jgi:hypothetical protein
MWASRALHVPKGSLMNSRSSRFHLAAKRTSAIAVVTAVIASLAATLTATPAAAAVPATGVSIDSDSQHLNVQAGDGSTATLNVSYSPTTSTSILYWAVLSGPATNPATPAFPGNVTPYTGSNACAPTVAGHAQCLVPNGGTPGTNTIEVFADNNADQKFDGGDVISGPTNVIFSDVPAHVTLTPHSSRSTAGTCILYTALATDSLGQPAVNRALTIDVSETLASGTGTITLYNIPPNTPPDCETPSESSVAAANPATITDNTQTTASDGTLVFGVSADHAGSGTVKVTWSGLVNDTATAVWTDGGPDSVITLAVSPTTSVTQYVGTQASYLVTATDHNGDPVQGVTVNKMTDAASPDQIPASPTTPCGVTNHLGQVTCSIINAGSGHSGTDTLTFWVDNSVPGTHGAGPDTVEPQVRATAIFRELPAFNSATLTCVDQLAGPTKNQPVGSCTLPTTQNSVTFTETLTNNGAPVVGAVIEFHDTSSLLGNSSTPVADTFVTTDANGDATFTVANPSPVAGNFVNVTAFLGTVNLNNASANWQTPQASNLALTPPLQSVTKGGQVTVVAQVTDQFGTPWATTDSISYSTGGPDSLVPGASGVNVPTSSTGSLVITYTSLPSATGFDVISAHDANGRNGQAKVIFLNGPSVASTVTVDTSGNGNSAVCPGAGPAQNTNLVLGVSNTHVCAIVKNSSNEVLAGKTVTFTVDIGQVDQNNPTGGSTKTYVTATNEAGIATAVVSSTTSGTQTVTATADGTSGTGTLTYALPGIDKARNISVTPTSAAITAGNSQKFTWKVIDQFGNPVSGVTLSYVQAGAGLSGATSSGNILTGPDGTASVVINTSASDTGAGSITATIQQPSAPTPLNQCGNAANNPASAATAGNCTAAATYTVTTGSPPAHVVLTTTQVTKGHQEVVTARVTNADGTTSANQVVRFLVTGANGLIGSAQTNSSGVAVFSYPAKHAGIDRISAFVDLNNDTLQESNEPGKHTKVIVGGIKEHPTMFLTTKHRSVTIHVRTHPVLPRAVVKYYVKRYGKFHKIGTSHAGLLGKASMKFFFPKGVVRTFKAKVIGNQGIKGGKTKKKTIRIR